MARKIVKQDKYQYLKEGNKLYRYPYVDDVKDYDYIGEEYDSTHLKWRKSSEAMAVKMAGHGVVVTSPHVSSLRRICAPVANNKTKKLNKTELNLKDREKKKA